MVTTISHHGVKDYEAFILMAKENLKNAVRDAQAGILETKLYGMADASGVIVTHTFNKLEEAQNYQKMFQSPEFQAMGEKIGIIFPLTTWITEEVKL